MHRIRNMLRSVRNQIRSIPDESLKRARLGPALKLCVLGVTALVLIALLRRERDRRVWGLGVTEQGIGAGGERDNQKKGRS